MPSTPQNTWVESSWVDRHSAEIQIATRVHSCRGSSESKMPDLEHNFMMPENEVTLADPNGDSIARELAILLAMNDLDKPFLRS